MPSRAALVVLSARPMDMQTQSSSSVRLYLASLAILVAIAGQLVAIMACTIAPVAVSQAAATLHSGFLHLSAVDFSAHLYVSSSVAVGVSRQTVFFASAPAASRVALVGLQVGHGRVTALLAGGVGAVLVEAVYLVVGQLLLDEGVGRLGRDRADGVAVLPLVAAAVRVAIRPPVGELADAGGVAAEAAAGVGALDAERLGRGGLEPLHCHQVELLVAGGDQLLVRRGLVVVAAVEPEQRRAVLLVLGGGDGHARAHVVGGGLGLGEELGPQRRRAVALDERVHGGGGGDIAGRLGLGARLQHARALGLAVALLLRLVQVLLDLAARRQAVALELQQLGLGQDGALVQVARFAEFSTQSSAPLHWALLTSKVRLTPAFSSSQLARHGHLGMPPSFSYLCRKSCTWRLSGLPPTRAPGPSRDSPAPSRPGCPSPS